MPLRASIPILSSLFLAAGVPLADGLAVYEEGRVAQAAEIWERAARAGGEEAPIELLLNTAIAKLELGEVKSAHEWTLAARPRAEGRAADACDFLLAHVAFERAKHAERILAGPEAGPVDMDRALGFASVAVEFWRRAVVSRSDWPEARRNAERAFLLLSSLRKRQEQMLGERKTLSTPRAQLKPGESEQGKEPKKPEEKKGEEEGEAQALRRRPESVEAVLERLRTREADRRERMQAARDKSGRAGSRDW